MDGPYYRFSVGSIRGLVLSDGRYDYPASSLLSHVDATELEPELRRHGITNGRIETPYACLLLDTGGVRVLLDTGGAGWDPTVGRLAESLRAGGVDPASIDLVVLTHGHPDHIGGTADDDGRPDYVNAVHVMAAAEWAWWTQESAFAALPPAFRRVVDHNLPPIADRVRLIDGEVEVAPGVLLVPTPGHTPGHVAVRVLSEGEELIYISDAMLHPLHLEHPGWGPRYDIDPQLAERTRRRLCAEAARSGALVHAFHFDPFPCLGRIEAAADAWRWIPLEVPRTAPAGPAQRTSLAAAR